MLRVWGRRTSVNVQKVLWAVSELGLAHETIEAGLAHGKLDTVEFGRLNPNRTIPVIEDAGFVLWESSAIVRYLARGYGKGTLAPEGAHAFALADQWMDWALTCLYGDIISTTFHGLIRTPMATRNGAAIEAAVQRAGVRLAILDAHLAGRAYILGDHLTMADIPAGALMFRYYTLPIARPMLANVEAWYQRLTERPAYRAAIMVDYASLKVDGA